MHGFAVKSPKTTKSQLSRRRKEERKEEEERHGRCVSGADKTESVFDNVSDSAPKRSKEPSLSPAEKPLTENISDQVERIRTDEAGITPLAGKPPTDHGTDQVKPGSGSGEDGEVTQQISESPLTDHETVHVQRYEAESEEVENQPSVETPLSVEKSRKSADRETGDLLGSSSRETKHRAGNPISFRLTQHQTKLPNSLKRSNLGLGPWCTVPVQKERSPCPSWSLERPSRRLIMFKVTHL